MDRLVIAWSLIALLVVLGVGLWLLRRRNSWRARYDRREEREERDYRARLKQSAADAPDQPEN